MNAYDDDDMMSEEGKQYEYPSQIPDKPKDPKDVGHTEVPEMLKYFDVLGHPVEDPLYRFTELYKEFKPVVYNEGKNMKFILYSNEFVDTTNFLLDIEIENPHLTNYLQLDGSIHSIIKSIKFSHDGQLLEDIPHYNELLLLLNDIYYKSNFFSLNVSASHPLQEGGKNLLIPPRERGNNLLFNPPQLSFDYMDNIYIKNGVLDFTTTNKINLSIPIFSYLFGTGIKKDKFAPMFLFKHGLHVDIELNEHCFFVPIFNAKIQDLINVNIDNEEYTLYRKYVDELKNAKKMISNIKKDATLVSKTPKSITNLTNSKVVEILPNYINSSCLFDAVSMDMYGTVEKSDEIKETVKDHIRRNKVMYYNMLQQMKINSEDYAKLNFISSFIRNTKRNMQSYFDQFFTNDVNSNEDFERFLDRMGTVQNSTTVEIVGICEAYKVTIELYDENFNFTDIYCPHNPRIIKLMLRNNHFDLITFKNPADKMAKAATSFDGLEFDGNSFFNLEEIKDEINYMYIKNIMSFEDIINFELIFDVYSKIAGKNGFDDNSAIEYFRTNLPNFFNYGNYQVFLQALRTRNRGYLLSLLNGQYLNNNFKSFSDFKNFKPFKRWGLKKVESAIFNIPIVIDALQDSKDQAKRFDILEDKEIEKMINVSREPTFINLLSDDTVNKDYLKRYLRGFFEYEMSNEIREDYMSIINRRFSVEEVDYLTSVNRIKRRIETERSIWEGRIDRKIDELMSSNNLDDLKRLFVENKVHFNPNNFNNTVQDWQFEDESLFLVSKLKKYRVDFGQVMDVMSRNKKVFSTVFLQKLNMVYGPKKTLEIVNFNMPGLFLVGFNDRIKELLEEKNYDTILKYINIDFVSRFGSFKELKDYNPFNVNKKLDSLMSTDRERLLKKMFDLGKDLKLINFVDLPQKNALLGVTGLLAKITNFMAVWPEANVSSEFNFGFNYDEDFLWTIKMYAFFVRDKEFISGGGPEILKEKYLKDFDKYVNKVSSSIFGEVNSKARINLINNIVRKVVRQVKREKNYVKFREKNSDYKFSMQIYGGSKKIDMFYSLMAIFHTSNLDLNNECVNILTNNETFGANTQCVVLYLCVKKLCTLNANMCYDTNVIGKEILAHAISNLTFLSRDKNETFNEDVVSLVNMEYLILEPLLQNLELASFIFDEYILNASKLNAGDNHFHIFWGILLRYSSVAFVRLENFVKMLANNFSLNINERKSEKDRVLDLVTMAVRKAEDSINNHVENKNSNILSKKDLKIALNAERAKLENILNRKQSLEMEKSKREGMIIQATIRISQEFDQKTRGEYENLIKDIENGTGKYQSSLKTIDSQIDQFNVSIDLIKEAINKINDQIDDVNDDFNLTETIKQIKKDTVEEARNLLENFPELIEAFKDDYSKLLKLVNKNSNTKNKINVFIEEGDMDNLNKAIGECNDILNNDNPNFLVKFFRYIKPVDTMKQVKETFSAVVANLFELIDNIKKTIYGEGEDDDDNTYRVHYFRNGGINYMKFGGEGLYFIGKGGLLQSQTHIDDCHPKLHFTFAKKLEEKINTKLSPKERIKAYFSGSDVFSPGNDLMNSLVDYIIENADKEDVTYSRLNIFSSKHKYNQQQLDIIHAYVGFILVRIIGKMPNSIQDILKKVLNSGEPFTFVKFDEDNIKNPPVRNESFGILKTDAFHVWLGKLIKPILMIRSKSRELILDDLNKEFKTIKDEFINSVNMSLTVDDQKIIANTLATYTVKEYVVDEEKHMYSMSNYSNNFQQVVYFQQNPMLAFSSLKQNKLIGVEKKKKSIVDYSVSGSLGYFTMACTSLFESLNKITEMTPLTKVITTHMLQIFEMLVAGMHEHTNLSMLAHFFPVLSNLVQNLTFSNVISACTIKDILSLSAEFNDIIKSFNCVYSTKYKTIEDTVLDYNDPKVFQDMIREIEDVYPSFAKGDNLQRQNNFELLNEEANISQSVNLFKNYQVNKCRLKIKEVIFPGDGEKNRVYASGYTVTTKMFEFVQKMLFNTRIPNLNTINLSKRNVINLYQYVTNKAYLQYPTYRPSCRFSRQVKTWGVKIGPLVYPRNYLLGNNSTFNENIEFIDNLVKSVAIEASAINQYNMLLDTSTTMFVTKKLYGYKDAKILNFDQSQNLHLNLHFGYNNEIIGKNIFSINFKDMEAVTNTSVDTANVIMEFVCESQNVQDDQFALYEMNTLIEYDNEISVTREGFLSSPFYKKI